VTLTGQDAVEAAHAAFGRHPGYRAFHARGTLLKGTFTATPEAAELTRAAHMQGDPVPVTARLSNGIGNPKSPDFAPDVRGLAVKFYLPDGSRTDIVAQTAPRFPFSEPGPFVEMIRAQGAGPLAVPKLALLMARHPKALPILLAGVPAALPPSSYAACRYYALHAFRFLAADGTAQYVRYTFLPDSEARRLAPWQARGRGREYLQEDIRRRLGAGPVRFTLELQLADPGDPVNDPSAGWPAERRRVRAGTLELTGLDTEREQGDDILVFDPCRVTDGIECSDDPVLLYRAQAYAASVAERTAR
jgi:catalase